MTIIINIVLKKYIYILNLIVSVYRIMNYSCYSLYVKDSEKDLGRPLVEYIVGTPNTGLYIFRLLNTT